MDREKVIVRTSVIGIVTNILLVIFKAGVGILSNSIAVVLDAVNNLSDAISSIVTIIGTKLANKKPTRKHPLGVGRIEYITALVVAALVIYAGITSGVESIKKIFSPEKPEYSVVSLIIIAVAVVVKFILGNYVKGQGKKVNSGALEASGKDALFDSILSLSVLVSAGISFFTGLSLEAYVGILIACFIVKAGVEMLLETLDEILGRRADTELTLKIKKLVREMPDVRGAYDLFLYNYGPERDYGSIHVEVPDTMSIAEMDVLTRQIEKKVHAETGIIMTAVGVYSYNTGNDEAAQMRDNLMREILKNDWAIQMHGFYIDTETRNARFDLVISFDIDFGEGLKIAYETAKKMYPDYEFEISPDIDITD